MQRTKDKRREKDEEIKRERELDRDRERETYRVIKMERCKLMKSDKEGYETC